MSKTVSRYSSLAPRPASLLPFLAAIFLLRPVAYANPYTVLHTFGGGDGANPSGLLLGPDGAIYGNAGQGFKISLDGSFSSLPAGPGSRAVLGIDGNFYDASGANLLQIPTSGSASQFASLPTNGSVIALISNLVTDGSGNLFGILSNGYLYKVATSGSVSQYSSAALNVGVIGDEAEASLTLGNDGDFYGTMAYVINVVNGGPVGYSFKIPPNGAPLTLDSTLGFAGSLITAADGNFYGVSDWGGAGNGAAFRMSPDGTLMNLYSFPNNSGYLEGNSGVLIQGRDGNFYGVTSADYLDDPVSYGGVLFKLTPTGAFHLLHTFTGTFSGGSPDGFSADSLVMANDGNLYGTASSGGNSGDGIVFRYLLTNPYLLRHGVYAAMIGGSGYIKITVSLNGSISGKLIFNGVTYTFTGVLDGNGSAFRILSGPPSVTLNLKLGLIDLSGAGSAADVVLTGTVSGSPFTAYHAPYGRANPTSARGTYTVLLDGTDPATAIPQGIGYATLTVSSAGAVTMTGKLADGSALACSGSLLTVDGSNQFFIYDKYSKGLLAGVISFNSMPDSDCNGSLSWTRSPQSTGAYYKSGFTTTLSAVGANYAKPPKGQLAIPLVIATGNAVVELADGGLANPVDQSVTLTSSNKIVVVGSNPEKLSMTISASTGKFSGSFIPPTANKHTSFGGVLYQNPNTPGAFGFFLGPIVNGTGLSGSVSLLPSP